MSPDPAKQVAETVEPSVGGEPEVSRPLLECRRRETLEDGRYLIYYTFEDAPVRPTE